MTSQASAAAFNTIAAVRCYAAMAPIAGKPTRPTLPSLQPRASAIAFPAPGAALAAVFAVGVARVEDQTEAGTS